MAAKKRVQKADTYGIRLVKGSRYFYKGVLFHRGRAAEVDLATRNHLVASGHFQDVDFEAPVAQPIPVRRKGSVRVQRSAEPGMLTAEGGATAEPSDLEGAAEV